MADGERPDDGKVIRIKDRKKKPRAPAGPLTPEGQAVIDELNKDHSVVIIGGRTRVLRFEDIAQVAGDERYVYRLPTYMRFDDFRQFYLNRKTLKTDGLPYAVDGRGQPLSIGQWWLQHPLRKQYRGVIFQPGGAPVIEDRLNLWTGFGVEARQGEWPRMREHIFEVCAARDAAVAEYDLNWLADCVQHPDRQAEVALALLGGVGTGKGILGRAMCRIFGHHARHISSPEDLTGKFNAHMQLCCFLFADEAVAPQDKKAESALKRLITEPTLFIEPKGIDKFEVPNRLHVMMASNHEWVFPATEKERRLVAQQVAAVHQQEEAWFTPLYAELKNGGLEAMLYGLLDRPLGDWRPRKIIRTAALGRQQDESLDPLDQWWLALLETGVLPGSPGLPNEAVCNAYEEEAVIGRDAFGGERRQLVRREGLYDQAKRGSPKLKTFSDTKLGRFLTDQGIDPCWIGHRRGRRFPPLSVLRDRWCARFPHTIWAADSPSDWTHGIDGET